MMSRLRDMTKWVLYILVLAFIALMVFEWGADFSALNQGGQSVIGEVDGREITYEQFSYAVRDARFREEQRTGSNLDNDGISRLRNQVWDDYVRRALLQKEIERLDITVSDADITNYIRQVTTQQYRNDPNFQTDGQFDEAKLLDVLTHPDNKFNIMQMEAQASQDLPYAKLSELINASVIITEQELRDEFAKQNLKAKLNYLSIPVSAFAKDSVGITEDEMRAYYNENKDDYKVEEMRKVNFAYFSLDPTAQDSADIMARAEDIKQRALNGEDFAALADAESQDPTVTTNHGDLGFFDKKTMVKEFTDAAFSAADGEIVGPVKTSFGLHIIKVIERKEEDGEEKVHAAHVLLKYEASPTTTDIAQRRADQFAAAAQESGFAFAADDLGVKVEESKEFAKNRSGQIPGAGRIESGMMWAFNTEPGVPSDVFYTSNGYYVLEVSEVKPAGFRPFEDVKNICKSRVETEKRKELAVSFAEQVASQVQPTTDFAGMQAIAESFKGVATADSTDFIAPNVYNAKFGRAPSVIARAFSMPLNETSGMLQTDRGVYWIRVVDRNEFDEEAFESQKAALRSRLTAQKGRTIYNQWFNKLKEEAEIVDNRHRFYRG